MTDTVSEIKSALSITDVVGAYVKLTKAGHYHKGLCPFHKEKTPSFMVSPERDFYHCFGCGKGGDIFTFIQEVENIDFKGALRLLADKAGIVITDSVSEKARDEKERLFAVLGAAEAFYKENLETRSDVKEYLEARGILPETRDRFRVGYAPNEWRAVSEHLQTHGYSERVIEDAGLTKRPDEKGETKKAYDRLRGRIIFPIRDVSGRTIGFSGRIFEDDPKHPQAKYINSPETAVFLKSHILYGLDMARASIRKYNFALLVEGQIDLLMAHQSGFSNAVALSGTSFTKHHASLIKRHTSNLLIAFDGDSAGVAAGGRAAMLAIQAGLNTKIALLPGGKDPADILRENPADFKKVVRDAQHVVDFYLHYLRELNYDERTFLLEASRTVLPFLNIMQNAIDRDYFIKRVADALGVSTESVLNELRKLKSPASETTTVQQSSLQKVISHDPFLSRGDTIERLLFGIFLVCKEKKEEECYARVHEALIAGVGEEKIQSVLVNPEYIRPSIIEADIYLQEYPDADARLRIIDELISDFKKETARREYREKMQELKQLETSQSAESTDRLVQEIAELAKRIT
jgi:DNA primase